MWQSLLKTGRRGNIFSLWHRDYGQHASWLANSKGLREILLNKLEHDGRLQDVSHLQDVLPLVLPS